MNIRKAIKILESYNQTPRDVIIAAIQSVQGHDPEYDDGIDADAIIRFLNDAGYIIVRK